MLRIYTQHILPLRISSPFAGEGHQEVMTALWAARPSNAMGQYAAFEVSTKLPLDVSRNGIVIPAFGRETQIGLKMFLDYPIQDRLGRIPAVVYRRSTSLCRLDGHVAFPIEEKNTKRKLLVYPVLSIFPGMNRRCRWEIP
jgi:hypothetical protein